MRDHCLKKFSIPMALILLSSIFLLSRVILTGSISIEPKTLKLRASPRYFGAALGVPHLQNVSDPLFHEVAAFQFSGATPENEMKWDATEPVQNQFNFTAGDVVRDFAREHNFKLRGHTLVWHEQLAPWVTELPDDEVQSAMQNHIVNVMGHYKGEIFAWDVVNEAFNDDGTLGASPFLTAIGPSYITLAFQTARKADPSARLYINDFNTEGINNKSDALLALVKQLKAENLIDGVGFQSHFIIGEVPTDLQENLQRFNDAGVEVAITELDLRATLPVSNATIAQQATDYATVVNACISVTKCVGITTWGITDLYSWIPGTFPGQGFGLLFDDNYVEKPSFFSTIKTL